MCKKKTRKIQYYDLKEVRVAHRCFCFDGIGSNIEPQTPVIFPGCGGFGKRHFVQHVVGDIKNRMMSKGEAQTLSKIDGMGVVLEHLNMKVDVMMKHLQIEPPPPPQ